MEGLEEIGHHCGVESLKEVAVGVVGGGPMVVGFYLGGVHDAAAAFGVGIAHCVVELMIVYACVCVFFFGAESWLPGMGVYMYVDGVT